MFQGLLHFSRKMVLCWLSQLCILEPFTNIQLLRRFDLSFWQTSQEVYRKVQHEKKIFPKFQGQLCFPRKMVLYSLTTFGIKKPWINISWLRRFNLGFCKTSKQIYRKFQYRDNIFGKFQGLPRFPRKIVLYSLTKFDIFEPCADTQLLQRLDLGSWQTLKQVFR